MLSIKGELVALSPRKQSLRNCRNFVEESQSDPGIVSCQNQSVKKSNLKRESENSKRKRRESHETSGSDKDESNRRIIVPKWSPTLNRPTMEMKKCKFETEKERMFRVSELCELFKRRFNE